MGQNNEAKCGLARIAQLGREYDRVQAALQKNDAALLQTEQEKEQQIANEVAQLAAKDAAEARGCTACGGGAKATEGRGAAHWRGSARGGAFGSSESA